MRIAKNLQKEIIDKKKIITKQKKKDTPSSNGVV
jgi:hypothetical protein